jgi:hypothetical protein
MSERVPVLFVQIIQHGRIPVKALESEKKAVEYIRPPPSALFDILCCSCEERKGLCCQQAAAFSKMRKRPEKKSFLNPAGLS